MSSSFAPSTVQTVNTLLQSPQCAGNPAFGASVDWKKDANGSVLWVASAPAGCDPVVTDFEPYKTVVLTAQVASNNLFVSPSGNYYGPGEYGSTLAKAKYGVTLVAPGGEHDRIFIPAYNMLLSLRDRVAYTKDMRHCTVRTDEGQQAIKVSLAVFEKKDGGSAEMAAWPVKSEFKTELESIATSYEPIPFPLYDINQVLVTNPKAVEGVLRDALVRVSFKYRHHYIAKKTGKKEKFDCFSAEIVNMCVLAKGKPVVPRAKLPARPPCLLMPAVPAMFASGGHGDVEGTSHTGTKRKAPDTDGDEGAAGPSKVPKTK